MERTTPITPQDAEHYTNLAVAAILQKPIRTLVMQALERERNARKGQEA